MIQFFGISCAIGSFELETVYDIGAPRRVHREVFKIEKMVNE
jgi:hypothetical protein